MKKFLIKIDKQTTNGKDWYRLVIKEDKLFSFLTDWVPIGIWSLENNVKVSKTWSDDKAELETVITELDNIKGGTFKRV